MNRPRVVGLLTGALAVVSVVASSLGGAQSVVLPTEAKVRILHAAPSLVEPATALVLQASPHCEGTPTAVLGCRLLSGRVHVLSEGSASWRTLRGSSDGANGSFAVDAQTVGTKGFSYWLELTLQDGRTVTYPPGGKDNPLVVDTTSGFNVSRVEALAWTDTATPLTELSIPYGTGPSEVGLQGTLPDQDRSGPSSFAVDGAGGAYVVDWVNQRVQVFSNGAFSRSIPLPVRRPADIAIDGDALAILTLGSDRIRVAGIEVLWLRGGSVSCRVRYSGSDPAVHGRCHRFRRSCPVGSRRGGRQRWSRHYSSSAGRRSHCGAGGAGTVERCDRTGSVSADSPMAAIGGDGGVNRSAAAGRERRSELLRGTVVGWPCDCRLGSLG